MSTFDLTTCQNGFEKSERFTAQEMSLILLMVNMGINEVQKDGETVAITLNEIAGKLEGCGVKPI